MIGDLGKIKENEKSVVEEEKLNGKSIAEAIEFIKMLFERKLMQTAISIRAPICKKRDEYGNIGGILEARIRNGSGALLILSEDSRQLH